MVTVRERDFSEFTFRTVPTDAVTAEERALMLRLFDACYRQANHGHLEKSLGRLRYVSFAHEGEQPAGFGLADARVLDLPALAQQTVVLGGLCCVLPAFRRRGLFGELMRRAVLAAEPPARERSLTVGRMGHPGAFRGLARNPTVVPKPGVRPTPWQQEIGQMIADVYGVDTFDPETFVGIGAGTPIGYPVIELEAEPHEWEVFRPVDRDRGDSLLGIAWGPDAPPGW